MKYKKHLSVYWILIPVIIISGLYTFYRIKKQDFLQTGLQNMVEKKSENLYKISYDSISVNEAEGDLFIKNLHITGDTVKQMQMVRRGDTNASKVILDIYIPLLKVAGFKTARALLSKQLECSEITINDVKGVVYLFPGLPQHKDETIQRREIYKQILGNLKLIKADKVSINRSEVTVRNYFTNEIKFVAYNTGVSLYNVLVDSTYREDTSRILFCKQIKVNADKVIVGEKNNTAHISGLVFNTVSKAVFISHFEYDAFKNNGFFKTSLHDISVDGIEWKGPAERSDLQIENIALKKGDIEIVTDGSNKKNNKANLNDKILNGWIKTFALKQLAIQSLSITSTKGNNKTHSLTIMNNALLLKGVELDSLSKWNESLINNVGEAEFKNNDLTIISDDKFYAYKISGFKFNTKERRVWIKRVAFVPQYNEEKFAAKSKFQNDRYDVNINNIECRNINISKLFKGELYMSEIITRNSSVKVFRDLTYPSNGESRIGSYPHQLLFKLKFPLKIDKLTASNTHIAYKEKNPLSDSSGTVTFNNSHLFITNISNLSSKAGDKAIVNFTTNLLREVSMKGSLIFNLDEWEKGSFTLSATIATSFDAKIFNQLTQPMSLIKINSGMFDQVTCNLIADEKVSKANVLITYHDFRVSLLKKKGEEVQKKTISSFLANAIIKNKNSSGKDMRVATIQNQRNVQKSFFNFIWASIFSGAKEIFGVPSKNK